MLITIRDANDRAIYFCLFNPDPVTNEEMLSGANFNLFIAGTPSSAPLHELLFLDPPYAESEIPPFMGWAKLTSSGYLVQYLGGQDTDAFPLADLQDFRVNVEEGRYAGLGTVNRSNSIGPQIVWELQP